MDTLTTGDIAKYCDVNLRTVIRWIEKGHLKSFKLPGRGNNRILITDFLAFMDEYQIPIPKEFRSYLQRVLIIDDDELMSRSINRVIKGAGYETLIVNNSFHAGEAIISFLPYIITLDLQMPGIDGRQILEHIKNNDDLKRLKIIVISAMPEEQLIMAKEKGADVVLAKPFDNRELVTILNKYQP